MEWWRDLPEDVELPGEGQQPTKRLGGAQRLVTPLHHGSQNPRLDAVLTVPCVLAKGEPGDDGKPGRQGIPGSPGEKVSETPVWEHPQPSVRGGGILFVSLDFEAELAQEHRALLQNLLTCLICTPVACSHRVHLETKVSLDQQERLAMR